MKSKIIFLLALLPFFDYVANASESEPDQTAQPIVVRTSEHNQPRTMGPNCYYYNGCVYIECDYHETYISGSVTRSSDGTQWSNSEIGNALQIEVSTIPGTYTLTFILSSGVIYSGEYVLTGSIG